MLTPEEEKLVIELIQSWKKRNDLKDDPMDGDDVEDFINEVKDYANLHQGNMSEVEYQMLQECNGDASYELECPACKTTFEVEIKNVGRPHFDVECPDCGEQVGSEFIKMTYGAWIKGEKKDG